MCLCFMFCLFYQVQVAQVMGKPTPKSPQNTGTPPLILRIPISSDQSKNTKDKVSFKNVTATISAVSRHFAKISLLREH